MGALPRLPGGRERPPPLAASLSGSLSPSSLPRTRPAYTIRSHTPTSTRSHALTGRPALRPVEKPPVSYEKKRGANLGRPKLARLWVGKRRASMWGGGAWWRQSSRSKRRSGELQRARASAFSPFLDPSRLEEARFAGPIRRAARFASRHRRGTPNQDTIEAHRDAQNRGGAAAAISAQCDLRGEGDSKALAFAPRHSRRIVVLLGRGGADTSMLSWASTAAARVWTSASDETAPVPLSEPKTRARATARRAAV